MSDSNVSRRDFMKVTGAGTAGLVLGGKVQSAKAAETKAAETRAVAVAPPMPERPLGQTGHAVRLFSLGGQATIERQGTDAESEAIVNRAIDLGVNYIDTAASYGRGISQVHIGRVMATTCFCSPISVIVVLRHRSNIKRLVSGTESRFGNDGS